jgi:hypothetical protein
MLAFAFNRLARGHENREDPSESGEWGRDSIPWVGGQKRNRSIDPLMSMLDELSTNKQGCWARRTRRDLAR